MLFFISQTKSSLDKIFYNVVHHHIIYMCDFLVNLDVFFYRGLHQFLRRLSFAQIRSHLKNLGDHYCFSPHRPVPRCANCKQAGALLMATFVVVVRSRCAIKLPVTCRAALWMEIPGADADRWRGKHLRTMGDGLGLGGQWPLPGRKPHRLVANKSRDRATCAPVAAVPVAMSCP